MDISQARALLTRINRLLDDHHAEGSTPSALERDLLKEYTRRFYEALDAPPTAAGHPATKHEPQPLAKPDVSTEPTNSRAERGSSDDPSAPHTTSGALTVPRPERAPSSVPPTQARPSAPAAAPPARKRPTIVFEDFEEAPAPAPAQPAPAQPARVRPAPEPPAPTPAKAPAYISVPDDVEEEVRRIESAPAPPRRAVAEEPTPYATAPSATLAPNPTRPASPAKVADLEPSLRELFTVERGTDLSDRLANAPIQDLKAGLSLNERLQYGKELFGGDVDLMTSTLQRLNGLGDYDEAAVALASTARRFDWTDGERQATARTFVKRVWRRFA